MPNLTWESITLKLRNPFRLSYGVDETRTAFWLRLKDDAGWGEGTIPSYYHIPNQAMFDLWQQASLKPEPFPDDPAHITAWVGVQGPAPARCALDLALHDRIGRATRQPLFALLGLPRPAPKPTSFTIAIDTPEEMARQAAAIPKYPIIKIKLGSEDDITRLEAIRRARPDARLRVDANAGWTREQAFANVRLLEKFNLEMIEQPLAKEDIEGLGLVQARTSIPVVADESLLTLEDVDRLAKAGVKGINLKLMKVGGLAPAVRVLRRAHLLGLRVMLGCMIETSIGVTAMAHLSGLAEWLDLDAPLLVSNDPFNGIRIDECAVLSLPKGAGIGVTQKQP